MSLLGWVKCHDFVTLGWVKCHDYDSSWDGLNITIMTLLGWVKCHDYDTAQFSLLLTMYTEEVKTSFHWEDATLEYNNSKC